MGTRDGHGKARRAFVAFALLAAAFALPQASRDAQAQNYPARPIRLIVPQAPGSASDTVARIVATELTRQIGQQMVVDNRPGGALTIGIDMVVKAPADGYTLGFGPVGALAISPNMVARLPYHVDKDLQPIAQLANNQMVLAVSPQLPLKSVRDVIAFAIRSTIACASFSPGGIATTSSMTPYRRAT